MRAGAIGVGDVHVFTHNLCAMGHQVCGASCHCIPGGATILTDLQVFCLLRDADINGLRGTVSILALRFIKHHKADAVHIVQITFNGSG